MGSGHDVKSGDNVHWPHYSIVLATLQLSTTPTLVTKTPGESES